MHHKSHAVIYFNNINHIVPKSQFVIASAHLNDARQRQNKKDHDLI